MSWVAVAVGVGSAVVGGANSAMASSSAKKANKKAEELQEQAGSIVQARQATTLNLPDLDLSDLRLEPEQIDTLGGVANAKTREEFTRALSQIGESFFPATLQSSAVDAANVRNRLPDVFDISSQIGNESARLRSEALDVFAPGSSERRAQTLDGLNSFLNFELPPALEQQLDRRAAAQSYRTGQTIGPVAQRASERMTYDELRNNFFRATQAGQAEQALNQANVGGAGVQQGLLPAPSLELELQNLERRRQASMLNLQNLVSQRVTNFQTEVSERESNLARQDQLSINRANLLLGQANAQMQTANAESRNAAQAQSQAFQALGSAAGQASSYSFARTPQANPSGYSINTNTGARSFNGVPVVNATVLS